MDLKQHYDKLMSFYNNNSSESIIEKTEIFKINIKENISLTVVVTSNDRLEQTYFTLKSWNYIAKKNNINIQVIIVDDTIVDDTFDKKLNIQELKSNENLEVIYIHIKNKNWVNPCLNYNIGFEFIKSNYVVIANSEVCVFGNIYDLIKNNLNENNYLVFDVFEFGERRVNGVMPNNNKELWTNCLDFEYKTISSFMHNKSIKWLQSESHNHKFQI